MNKEDKDLLIQDLCARIPYHPRIQVINRGWEGCQEGEFDTDLWTHHVDALWFDRIEVIPYLRPLNSLTIDELEFISKECCILPNVLPGGKIGAQMPPEAAYILINYYNKNHIDFRGLIDKGLAIAVTDEHNPYLK